MIKRKKQVATTTPRHCYFCQNKIVPDYKEVSVLARFVSDRGKVVSRSRSGACARHQRALSRQIKRARFLALLPFESKVK